jgi:hypothetical protein
MKRHKRRRMGLVVVTEGTSQSSGKPTGPYGRQGQCRMP